MRKLRSLPLVLAGLAFAGCARKGTASAAGTVAVSADGHTVYALDHDDQAIEVFDATLQKATSRISVGVNPSHIAEGPDGRLYVTNQGERTVSVVDPTTSRQIAKLPTGVEPNGLALSPDGRTLYVVSATDLNDPSQGTLSAYDTAGLTALWSVQVGEEPRGLALVGGKAFITNLKQGRVTVVDTALRSVAGSIDLNNGDDPDPATNPTSASAGLAADVVASADGNRLYIPHVWQRNGTITSPLNSPEGYYASGGPCGTSSVVSPAVGTIDVGSQRALVDSFTQCQGSGSLDNSVTYPPSVLFPDRSSGSPSAVLQQPVAALTDATSAWLFVVNQASNNVVVMPTHSRVGSQPTDANVAAIVDVGAGPDGIGISADGKTAYVYAQLDHALSVLQADPSSSTGVMEVDRVTLASDTLPPNQVAGRKLFYSAVDPRISAPSTGVSCSSCHVAGRDDGHTWGFLDGFRQTPSLAGRHLDQTAPYHWTGAFPTVESFLLETIQRRMGGTGLDHTSEGQLESYLLALPAPENPLQNRPDLAAALADGQRDFAKAGCQACHTGEILTDNGIHNVGTLDPSDQLEQVGDEVSSPVQFVAVPGMNTPSLAGIGRTAPYLHDGSALTLRDRLDQSRFPKHGGTDHGDTSQLSDQEMSDLQTYLESL